MILGYLAGDNNRRNDTERTSSTPDNSGVTGRPNSGDFILILFWGIISSSTFGDVY
jgi:hypothetical protein